MIRAVHSNSINYMFIGTVKIIDSVQKNSGVEDWIKTLFNSQLVRFKLDTGQHNTKSIYGNWNIPDAKLSRTSVKLATYDENKITPGLKC